MSFLNCDSSGGATTWTEIRISPVFAIWATGMLGAAFPILAHRSCLTHIPSAIFDFAKYVGSGVIIATAVIHLLPPAIGNLTSPCLGVEWKSHPYPLVLTFLPFFTICIIGILAFHIGAAKLMSLGIHYNPHGYRMGTFIAHGQGTGLAPGLTFNNDSKQDPELEKMENGNGSEAGLILSHIDGSKRPSLVSDENAMAELVGVAVLEFGIILHSVLIGLTLAIDNRFKVLFVAAILYQMFDGLALGSRLAYLDLPHKYRNVTLLGALLYGVTTPIGIAIGLGTRMIYTPNSIHASLVSGILDTLSASILMYTGFVELLAQEFLFRPGMHETSIWKHLYALACMMLGFGAVAFLDKWA